MAWGLDWIWGRATPVGTNWLCPGKGGFRSTFQAQLTSCRASISVPAWPGRQGREPPGLGVLREPVRATHTPEYRASCQLGCPVLHLHISGACAAGSSRAHWRLWGRKWMPDNTGTGHLMKVDLIPSAWVPSEFHVALSEIQWRIGFSGAVTVYSSWGSALNSTEVALTVMALPYSFPSTAVVFL